MDLDVFMSISRAALADPDLDPAYGEHLLTDLERLHGTALGDLLESAAAEQNSIEWVERAIVDATLKATLTDIVLSWLFGAPYKDGVATASHGHGAELWFGGRFWRYVLAHAPAAPGGYFGHWMYPAEDK